MPYSVLESNVILLSILWQTVTLKEAKTYCFERFLVLNHAVLVLLCFFLPSLRLKVFYSLKSFSPLHTHIHTLMVAELPCKVLTRPPGALWGLVSSPRKTSTGKVETKPATFPSEVNLYSWATAAPNLKYSIEIGLNNFRWVDFFVGRIKIQNKINSVVVTWKVGLQKSPFSLQETGTP